jgi:LysR family transcriptional regulator, benzoate and cis,cis-muconate-responsive activator of ben and cat genes
MDARHLRYVLAIADTGSFTRAAARLGMSQPPLSAQIGQLEREVGARLFDRGRRATTLTAAGEVFVAEARTVLSRLDVLAERVRAVAEARPRLAVGYVSALSDERLPRVLAGFRERANVELHDLPEDALLANLLEGQLDAAFLAAGPKRSRALHFSTYRRDPLGVITARGERLVTLSEQRCLVLPEKTSREGHARAMQLYRRARVSPERIVTVATVTAIVDTVAAGLGVAVLPRGAVRSAEVTFHRFGLPSIDLVAARAREGSVLARELVERMRG